MNKRFVRGFAIFAIIFACVFALTSCGKKGYNTSYSAAEASTPDKYDDAVDWAEIQIADTGNGISDKPSGKKQPHSKRHVPY